MRSQSLPLIILQKYWQEITSISRFYIVGMLAAYPDKPMVF
jgi:hypothetical protein